MTTIVPLPTGPDRDTLVAHVVVNDRHKLYMTQYQLARCTFMAHKFSFFSGNAPNKHSVGKIAITVRAPVKALEFVLATLLEDDATKIRRVLTQQAAATQIEIVTVAMALQVPRLVVIGRGLLGI